MRWIAAFGYGGQRLFIVPEFRMVVAVTAGLYGKGPLMGMPGEVVLRRYALASLTS